MLKMNEGKYRVTRFARDKYILRPKIIIVIYGWMWHIEEGTAWAKVSWDNKHLKIFYFSMNQKLSFIKLNIIIYVFWVDEYYFDADFIVASEASDSIFTLIHFHHDTW